MPTPCRGDQAAPATGGRRRADVRHLVGLELRPRRLREAATIWQGLTEARGSTAGTRCGSPGPAARADDLENPDTFVHGQPELDISDLETRT